MAVHKPSKNSIPHFTERRRLYICNHVKKQAQKCQLWGQFQQVWIDAYAQRSNREDRQKRAWYSFKEAVKHFRTLDFLEAAEDWRLYRRNGRLTLELASSGKRLAKALKTIDEFELLDRLAEVEKGVHMQTQEERKAAIEMRNSLTAQMKAETEKMLAEAKLEAAKMEAKKAKRMDSGRNNIMNAETGDVISLPVKPPESRVEIEDEGPVDLLRDVRWVYANLSKLIIQDSMGANKLDVKTLRTAPSTGAVGMAEYAVNDTKAFFDKFVIKLLPKDTQGQSETEKIEEKSSDLDPSFGALQQFLVPETKKGKDEESRISDSPEATSGECEISGDGPEVGPGETAE